MLTEKDLDAAMAELQKSWPDAPVMMTNHSHAPTAACDCAQFPISREAQEQIARWLVNAKPYTVLRAFLAERPGCLTQITAGLHPRAAANVTEHHTNVFLPAAAAPNVKVEGPATQNVHILSLPKPAATETTVKRDGLGRVEKTTRKAVTA